ncbi:MAG TPA: ABC transporter permease [Streptosporangiaceae bacterium]|jgi:peptide/nickel transport system permease protein|nr:ABC transporter permease [Streptosporangiaceae bacterium]
MRMLARRLPFYAITFVIAITIDFFIPRLMPGNALDAVLAKAGSQMGSPQALRALEKLYGVNNPAGLATQYTQFWARLVHGDLGISTSSYPTPVTAVIGTALPWTVALVGVATVISFVLGTLIGVLVAWRRGSWLDNLLPVTTFFQAAPYFFLAFLAIEVFSVKLGWFPYGLGQNQLDYQSGLAPSHVADVLDHALLPALTIVVASAAGWIVGMRNQMLSTMDEDYVLIAQAKGLPKRRVVWYAARNAILPSVSGFSLAIGFVISGALLTEIVFAYPGLGFVLYQAVINHDAPLMQGIFLIITLAVLAANLLADFAYLVLDPRIRQEA